MKRILATLAFVIMTYPFLVAQEGAKGIYFHKKEYIPAPLPSFEDSRAALPSPVWDENPEWVSLYWRAWEIAFSNLQQPPAGSPLVANWIDEGLSPQISLVMNGKEYKVAAEKHDIGL